MNLVERVQAILLKPKETWPVIEGESGDIASIYKNYLIYLAAIPAVATFIGWSLIGTGMFGISFRVPIVTGFVSMIVGFAMSLVMTYVLALIADALAPSFNGQKNMLNAFKLVAYGATAGMVGGVLNILPALSMLGVLAGLYSIYLIYVGVPVMMKVPQEKSLGYTAVLILCAIVASVIMGVINGLFTGGSAALSMGSRSGDEVEFKVPGSEITINTAKLEEASKQMEAASKQMEAAQASGDADAMGKAVGQMMGAAMGGGQGGGKPFEPETLRGYVPEKLGGMTRSVIEARMDNAMGMSVSSVTSEFRNDDGRVEIKVQDIGALPMVMMAMGAWASSTVDRETQEEVEKVYKRDGVAYKEQYRKDGSQAELSMILPNGVLIEATGDNVNMDGVRTAMSALDVKGLAGLKRQQ